MKNQFTVATSRFQTYNSFLECNSELIFFENESKIESKVWRKSATGSGAIDELRKLKPINAENPRELKKFADLVEGTVVTLKENKQNSDLEGGTLYAIVMEKIPQSLLSQYFRWIKEKGKLE